jgi:hypothetical protein
MSALSSRARPKHLGRVILRQVFQAVSPSQPAKSVAPAPHFLPRSVTVKSLFSAWFAPAASFDMRPHDKHTEIKGSASV